MKETDSWQFFVLMHVITLSDAMLYDKKHLKLFYNVYPFQAFIGPTLTSTLAYVSLNKTGINKNKFLRTQTLQQVKTKCIQLWNPQAKAKQNKGIKWPHKTGNGTKYQILLNVPSG